MFTGKHGACTTQKCPRGRVIGYKCPPRQSGPYPKKETARRHATESALGHCGKSKRKVEVVAVAALTT